MRRHANSSVGCLVHRDRFRSFLSLDFLMWKGKQNARPVAFNKTGEARSGGPYRSSDRMRCNLKTLARLPATGSDKMGRTDNADHDVSNSSLVPLYPFLPFHSCNSNPVASYIRQPIIEERQRYLATTTQSSSRTQLGWSGS